MKCLYIGLLIVLGMTATVSAQESLKVVDSIFFRSDNSQDFPFYRVFGFGSGHTNLVDTDEVAFPQLPPAPYLAAGFISEDLQEKYFEHDFVQSDVRGLPDSVAGGNVKQFSLEYEMKFQRGQGQLVTIGFPIRLARGIDSIHIEDVEGSGGVYSYTYTGANSYLFTIQNKEVAFMRMRVYYNLVTASVASPAVIVHNTKIFPNPVRNGQNVTLLSDAPAGSRVVISDLLGQPLFTRSITEQNGRVELDCAPLASGTYFVRLVGNNGDLLDHRQLIVLQ
jgi:hypothetical protein